MFSQTIEYALRAMIYLASVERGEVTSAGRIAQAVEVPQRYLSKVMRGLVVAKLVESTRGPKGGFVMRGEPESITVRDIVDAVGCTRGCGERDADNRAAPGRRAHPASRGAMESVEHAMRSTTLADMLYEHRKGVPEQGHGAD